MIILICLSIILRFNYPIYPCYSIISITIPPFFFFFFFFFGYMDILWVLSCEKILGALMIYKIRFQMNKFVKQEEKSSKH
ncbi:hypothetical protein CICLE_v10013242mg [Citrus x clementina]|uniref:Uncharacterized protein n=1 Tax=Citrus clementina TaxID=85681 RepID=V4SXQ1_CITCL|nr:hypothetical protein CICLE_v10013242mg [Citrus x clementina]